MPKAPSPERRQRKQAHVDLLTRGMALQRQRRFIEAERCYQTVLRESPRNPDAQNLLGTLALEARRPDAAAKLFRGALKELPNEAGYLNNLGAALLMQHDFGGAEKALRRAVELDPGFVDAICNLGQANRQLNRSARALELYERALTLAPGLAKATLGLAGVLVDAGEMARATELYRQVLADDPENTAAYIGLATAHRFKPDDPEPRAMADLAARATDDAPTTPALHHAAGKAMADLGQYDDAFAQFRAAKSLATQAFDLDRYRGRHGAIMATMTREFFAERGGYGVDAESPTFIVGMPRSGTTLAEQICSSHSAVSGAGELATIGDFGRELGASEADVAVHATLLARMTAGQSRDIAKLYLSQLNQYGSGQRITDKMPHNFEHLGLIALLFPNARIIHCERDPIDTCVSCFTHHFNENHGYNTDLAVLGQYYREYRRLMAHWRSVLPLRMLDFSYEELIADQEGKSRELIAFLGLDWEDACLDFHTNDRLVLTPSRWQVRQPIYKSSVKAWKKYEKHLEPLFEALGDLAVID